MNDVLGLAAVATIAAIAHKEPRLASSTRSVQMNAVKMNAIPAEEDDDDDFVCFPIGQEDCETCEYMEDWSEYYGERVPSTRMFLPTAALTLCP